MREIKFRCFNVAANLMHNWSEMKEHGNIYRLLSFPEKYPVMQYTGLKDINGVEIYELSEIDGKYRVIFRNASYVLQNISTGDIVGLLSQYMVRQNDPEITREYAPVEEN